MVTRLSRCREYEETLPFMHQRITTSTRAHQEALGHDIEELMNVLRQVLTRLKSL